MRFGVREICNVVFKAKSTVMIGKSEFKKGQPVLYIDSAKTSSMEQAATTVYAQGGRGNTRLLAWEGEKTLTFTVEDALISPIGLSVLSGAGIVKGTDAETVYVHSTTNAIVNSEGKIDLSDVLEVINTDGDTEKIDTEAPVFVMLTKDNSFTGEMIEDVEVSTDGKSITVDTKYAGETVFVDYYVSRVSSTVSELQIDAENFAGYYYVEASTLFRRESDGVDMPAEITFPKIKIQSNFTFSMASTGDPSTFTFTMDAFPDYTMFDKTKKVLCAIQVVEEAMAGSASQISVMDKEDGYVVEELDNDSQKKN